VVAGQEDLEQCRIELVEHRDGVGNGVLRKERQRVGDIAELQFRSRRTRRRMSESEATARLVLTMVLPLPLWERPR